MASRPFWRLSGAEWKSLGAVLAESPRGDKPKKGRPRHVKDRDIAEACLFLSAAE